VGHILLGKPARQGNKIVLGGNGQENQMGCIAPDEIASCGNRCVTSLYGFLDRGEIITDDDVDIVDLQHGQTPTGRFAKPFLV
jgi:hypothetical protein